ncbi:GON-4-like protein [Saccoglossus kowalevskii]
MSKDRTVRFEPAPYGSGSKEFKTPGDNVQDGRYSRKADNWKGRIHVHESPKKAWLAKVAQSEAERNIGSGDASCQRSGERCVTINDVPTCNVNFNNQSESVRTRDTSRQWVVGDKATCNSKVGEKCKADSFQNYTQSHSDSQGDCKVQGELQKYETCVVPLEPGTSETVAIIDEVIQEVRRSKKRKHASKSSVKKRLKLDYLHGEVIPNTSDKTPKYDKSNEMNNLEITSCSKKNKKARKIVKIRIKSPKKPEADRLLCSTPKKPEADRLLCSTPKKSVADRLLCSTPKKSEADRLLCSTPKKPEADRLPCSTPKKSVADRLLCSTPEKIVADHLPCSTPKKTVSDHSPNSPPSKEKTGDELEIDEELDRQLEANADKNHLTAINVKSILHHVITNEHVLAMVRNTMKEQTTGHKSDQEPAVYEPKMTRSKLKEVTEKGGTLPIPWPISPLKQKSQRPQFQDLDFSDSDCTSDEDYKPEEESERESDYESVASSQVSDFGSPCPRTPLTPRSYDIAEIMTPEKQTVGTEESNDGYFEMVAMETESSSKVLNVCERHVKAAVIPMGPPPPKPLPACQTLELQLPGTELSDANLTQEEKDLIAFRTRSKLPLIDTPLDLIEANFVAPDITTDMYETNCEDQEWTDWLTSLMKEVPDTNDTFDDEQNDPEYNYLAEEEPEDVEDFRNDRAVQITKKEVNELLDELLEAYGNGADLVDDFPEEPEHFNIPPVLSFNEPLSILLSQQKETAEMQLRQQCERRRKKEASMYQNAIGKNSLIMSLKEREELQQQLQQHVQLLCQVYVLSIGESGLEKEASQCRVFVNEAEMFAVKNESTFEQNGYSGMQSAFRTCNLQGALKIVHSAPLRHSAPVKTDCKKTSKNSKTSERPPPIKEWAQDIIAHDPVFMYAELLPICGLSNHPQKKHLFAESEDNLLALGLEQFKRFDNWASLISQHLLPVKSVEQIKIRVKNLSATRARDNVVKLYKRHGTLPAMPVFIEKLLPGNQVPPLYLTGNRKPDWLKEYERKLEYKRISEGTAMIKDEQIVVSERRDQDVVLMEKAKSQHHDIMAKTNITKIDPEDIRHKLYFSHARKPDPMYKTILPANLEVEKESKLKEGKITMQGTWPKFKSKGRQKKKKLPVMKPSNIMPQPTVVPSVCLPSAMIAVPVSVSSSPSLQVNVANSPLLPISMASPTTLPLAVSSVATLPVSTPQPAPVSCSVGSPAIMAIPPSDLQGHGPSVQPSSISSPLPSPLAGPQTTWSDTASEPNFASNNAPTEQPNISTVVTKPSALQVVAYNPSNLSMLLSNTNSTAVANVVVPSSDVPRPAPASPLVQSYVASHSPVMVLPISPHPALVTSPIGIVKSVSSPGTCHPPASSSVVMTTTSASSASSFVMTTSAPGVMITSEMQNIRESLKSDVRIEDVGDKSDEITTVTNKTKQTSLFAMYDCRDGEDAMQHYPADYMSDGEEKNEVNSNEDDDRSASDSEEETNHIAMDIHDENSSIPYESTEVAMETSEAINEDDGGLEDKEGVDENTDSNPCDAVDKPKSIGLKNKRMKTRFRKDLESTITLLQPDILENDPMGAEKDNLLAQAFITRVKSTLLDQPERYKLFLEALHNYGQTRPPVSQLFKQLSEILVEWPELLEDFSCFLSAEEALECGLFMSHLEFIKAKTFLRQMEVYFQKQPNHYQKILKAFTQWGSSENKTYTELKSSIIPLLRGQPHLEQELMHLIPDAKPPESYMTDFEEIIWEDKEDYEHDGFEEIELPDSDDEKLQTKTKNNIVKKTHTKGEHLDLRKLLHMEIYGTKDCQCRCHQSSNDLRVQRKVRHCVLCNPALQLNRAEMSKSELKARCGGMGERRKQSRKAGYSRQDSAADVDDGRHFKDVSAACVTNLSEMCNNLADILNENSVDRADDSDDSITEAGCHGTTVLSSGVDRSATNSPIEYAVTQTPGDVPSNRIVLKICMNNSRSNSPTKEDEEDNHSSDEQFSDTEISENDGSQISDVEETEDIVMNEIDDICEDSGMERSDGESNQTCLDENSPKMSDSDSNQMCPDTTQRTDGESNQTCPDENSPKMSDSDSNQMCSDTTQRTDGESNQSCPDENSQKMSDSESNQMCPDVTQRTTDGESNQVCPDATQRTDGESNQFCPDENSQRMSDSESNQMCPDVSQRTTDGESTQMCPDVTQRTTDGESNQMCSDVTQRTDDEDSFDIS